MSETVAQAMVRTSGRPRGFDYLRILLSVGVLVWHSARVSYPHFAMDGWLRPTAGLILPMFFALSGFLISGSLGRSTSMLEFGLLRAIRILPALAVETVLSLFIIGTIFTVLPIEAFYSHPRTYRYLLNIVGWVQLPLPGVFGDLPFRGVVNASLWTVPFELECYLVIAVLWALGIVRRPWALLAAAVCVTLLVLGHDYLHDEIMSVDRRIAGRVLVSCFLFGVVMFQFRERIVLNRYLLGLAALMAVGLMYSDVGSYLIGLPAAYITVYLGFLNPPKIPVVMDGDYSYGVYLYSFPLQQAVIALSPPPMREWYINAPISLLLASLAAAFSWHVVEKPILHQRKHLVGMAERLIARLTGGRPPRDRVTVSAMDIKSG